VTLACDVAIVGAGPTGLTLANLLGQAGIRVILVERNEGTVREPRAVSIDDESLRAMQAIGLSDAVTADVALDYGSHYCAADGTRFVKVEPATREFGFPRRNAFIQPKLEATLREALKRFSNVTALFGCRFDSFLEDSAGLALRIFSPKGGPIEVQCSYLAACDGAHSAIRKRIGASMVGSTYHQRWLIVDLAHTREQLRQTRVVCNPTRPLITLPGPDGTRRYEFMLHEGEHADRAVEPDFVRGLLAAHGPDADAPIVRRQVYTFHARIADRWRQGRVFLAGDAAHLSPPFAGQGMNSGIRDAHNLGWKLAEVVRDRLGPALLDTYQAERAPHARALIALAMKMGRIMMPASRAQAFLVQSGFRLACLSPRLQSYFAEMKYKPKPFYQDGFIAPARDGLRLVGRMLPQPQVEDTDRLRVMLDERLGHRFCLLAYGPDAQRALAQASRLDFGWPDLRRIAVLPMIFNPVPDMPEVKVLRDVADTLAKVMPAGKTLVLLVRPDRYVAAAAFSGADSLRQLAADMGDLLGKTISAQSAADPLGQACRRSTAGLRDQLPERTVVYAREW
jgi:3-(3-hydroxy-phenyl)propionate hydroxylase